jgi:hypothetical protein
MIWNFNRIFWMERDGRQYGVRAKRNGSINREITCAIATFCWFAGSRHAIGDGAVLSAFASNTHVLSRNIVELNSSVTTLNLPTTSVVAATVTSSLYDAVEDAGLSPSLAVNLQHIFGGRVTFRRDIHPVDWFSAVLSTGPYLHFGIKVDWRRRNPLTVALPDARPLPVDEKAAFQRHIAPLITALNQLAAMRVSSVLTMDTNDKMGRTAHGNFIITRHSEK